MGGKRAWLTVQRGVFGVGAGGLDEKYQESKYVGTYYGGLVVSPVVKRQLERQPINEMVYYRETGLENYWFMQRTIPEFGRSDGIDYPLRKYYQKFMKVLVYGVFDDDGTLMRDVLNEFEMSTNDSEKFMEYCKIPENEREQFQTFFRENFDALISELSGVKNVLDRLGTYEKVARNLDQFKGEECDELVSFLKREREDYVNYSEMIRRVHSMKPETEKEFFTFSVCTQGARMTRSFAEQANRYREDHHIPGKIELNTKVIKFPAKGSGDLQIPKFLEHALTETKVTINGGERVLTLENTAPPAGRYLFHPEKTSTALGLYRNEEDVDNAYKDDRNLFVNFASAKDKDCLIRISQKFRSNKYPGIPYRTDNYKKNVWLDMAGLMGSESKSTHKELVDELKVVDSMVWSSDAFSNMRKALEKCKDFTSDADRIKKMKELRECAEKYIHYKHPNGNAKKEKGMSDLAKTRLEYAKKVFSFAYNGEKAPPTVQKKSEHVKKTEQKGAKMSL